MADERFEQFWKSAGGSPGTHRQYCYQGWRAAIEFMEEKLTSDNKKMDAITCINARCGWNDTKRGWCGLLRCCPGRNK